MSLFSFLGDIVKGGVDLATGNVSGAINEGVNALTGGGTTAGSAIGAATTAAGNNRLDQEKMALDANSQNISGQSAMENALMARAAEEAAQRKTALKQLALQSAVANPAHSPFDPVAAKPPSAAFQAALESLAKQNDTMLASPASTQVSTMAPVSSYTALPTNAQQLQKATGTAPSLFERIGDIAGPALTLGGIAANGAAKGGVVPQVPGIVPPMGMNVPGATQANGLFQLPQAVMGNFGSDDEAQD